jgi:hypothetical protein
MYQHISFLAVTIFSILQAEPYFLSMDRFRFLFDYCFSKAEEFEWIPSAA